MPSSPRRTVVSQGEVGVYHCWNRCVQRAWLCGQDPVTGIDYESRREVIEEVERQLAGLFAIDIGFHAEQANHLHLILRTRPDLAKTYSDDEVLRRSWIVARLKRTGNSRSRNRPTSSSSSNAAQRTSTSCDGVCRMSRGTWRRFASISRGASIESPATAAPSGNIASAAGVWKTKRRFCCAESMWT